MWNTLVRAVAHSALIAQTEGGAAPGSETARNPLSNMWLFFVALIAIMYFFLFRPQQKREKERREMLASLSKGDRAITTGGIIGTIVGLTEKTVVLRVSEEPNVKIEFARGAISRKIASERELDEDAQGA